MIDAIMRISPSIETNQTYSEMESPPPDSNNHEDQRALQIALELSNLGLLGAGDDDSSTSSYDEITKSKKSQNMTECVPVPSSEHVAEIVGRQGCKIKALRAKTNTYIKTPVRGEEPVFVVTGRKEDVAMARREIQSAAEHFTQIRATRNKGVASTTPGNPVLNNMTHMPGTPTAAELSAPGMITLQVRVPYRVVGLVVGPKGATIKRIQQQTHTYIVTPSREKEPVFEVTGLPENVEKAKEEIEAHIATRTGCQQLNIEEDFANNGILVGSPAQQMAQKNMNFMSQQFFNKQPNPQASAFTRYNGNMLTQNQRQSSLEGSEFGNYIINNPESGFINPAMYNNQNSMQEHDNPALMMREQIESGMDILRMSRKYSNESGTMAPAWSTNMDYPNDSTAYSSILSNAVNNGFNVDNSGFQSRSSSSTSPPLSNILTHRLSPTLSDPEYVTAPAMLPPSNTQSPPIPTSLPMRNNFNTDGMITTKTVSSGINIESGYSSGGTSDSQTSGSPVDSLTSTGSNNSGLSQSTRSCVLCHHNSVMAALVPCGHNLFCYSCAKHAADTSSACPHCSQTATMALLIKT